MLGNLDDAHDIAQQAFLRVWKAAPRYRASARFTTWLFTILRNLVFNESRRRTRRSTVSLDERTHPDEAHGSREFADTAAQRPDAALLDAELEAAIARAIERLPEQQRLALVLRRYQDISYEEIAVVLKTTVPAVKSLLFRARTQLRDDLREYLGEETQA
jgi:RNA polymerase sigma-70 factor (ECF subfamily)